VVGGWVGLSLFTRAGLWACAEASLARCARRHIVSPLHFIDDDDATHHSVIERSKQVSRLWVCAAASRTDMQCVVNIKQHIVAH
jgi:hypothetical protein